MEKQESVKGRFKKNQNLRVGLFDKNFACRRNILLVGRKFCFFDKNFASLLANFASRVYNLVADEKEVLCMLESEMFRLAGKIMKEKHESQTLEIKAAHGGFPKIYDTLSSFSNQDDGGIIVFGIDESKDFEVVGIYNNDVQDIQHRIAEACKQMEPEVRAVISSAEINGKMIVTAEIPGTPFAQRPVYYKGAGINRGSFIRVGDADEQMNDQEIYRYEAYRGHIRDDIRTVQGADFGQLRRELLEQYILSLRMNRTNIQNLSDDELIDMMGIRKDGLPTLAAIMSFSKYPQAVFPQLCVTAVLVPGKRIGDVDEDGNRFLANKRIEGTIAEMTDEAVRFVARNMRQQVGFDSTGKRIDQQEYPLGAVREIILNALIHRDYSTYTEGMPVRIELYDDRLEISNPGGLFGMVTVDTLGRVKCDVRNSTLVSMLETVSVVENRFSGIPTIYKLMSEAGLPQPVFKDEKGTFTVILYNADHQKNDSVLNSVQRELLDFCTSPKSRKEISEHLEKTQYYAMKKYVEPLIAQGLLAYTMPETPKSPQQKIFTVK